MSIDDRGICLRIFSLLVAHSRTLCVCYVCLCVQYQPLILVISAVLWFVTFRFSPFSVIVLSFFFQFVFFFLFRIGHQPEPNRFEHSFSLMQFCCCSQIGTILEFLNCAHDTNEIHYVFVYEYKNTTYRYISTHVYIFQSTLCWNNEMSLSRIYIYFFVVQVNCVFLRVTSKRMMLSMCGTFKGTKNIIKKPCFKFNFWFLIIVLQICT